MPQPETYRRLRQLVILLTRLFFRRVEVAGFEHLPTDRGGVLVAWHPNGVVDPLLIFSVFPFQVVFGARHGLFRYPVIGGLMRAGGTVPIYRRQDLKGMSVDEQRVRNAESLDNLAQRIADGSFSALFPEGASHDAPRLQELKSGAARLYYRARALVAEDRESPVVIPVGIHYDKKRVFRSRVLIEFHPSIELPAELDVRPALDEDPDEGRTRARALTDVFDDELRRVVLEADSWELHHLFHRARKLIRAERAHRAEANPGSASIDEKVLGFARVWQGYHTLAETHPALLEPLVERIREHDADLTALKLEDHELDHPPALFSLRLWLALILQLFFVFLLLPPVLLVGYVVNLPPAAVLALVSRIKKDKDVASIKIVLGAILFPAVWALWGALAAWGVVRLKMLHPMLPASPFWAGATMVALSMLGALVAMFYVRLSLETRRALRVRMTRRFRTRTIARLRAERSELCDRMLELVQGVELPGVVREDGSIGRD